MRCILLLLFLYIPSKIYSQVNDEIAYVTQNYDKKFIIAHKIKSIAIDLLTGEVKIKRELFFDSAGNMIHAITYDNQNKKVNETFFRFNQFGDLTFTSHNDYIDNVSDSSTITRSYNNKRQVREYSKEMGYKTEYFYNHTGQLEKSITQNNSGDTVITLHHYDSNNNEVERIRLARKTRNVVRNRFDSNNLLTELIEITFEMPDTTGKIILHKKFSYNHNNKKIKEEFIEGYLDFDTETKEFFYNRKNDLIEIKSGKEKTNYTYDDKGFLTKKQSTEMKGLFKTVELYNYKHW
jgi:hypothetical protein